ncbi:hypothetical protein LOD44_04580 [Xylella fastidiosa subsp. multiplex]|uniref:hypothetical protein n=1 Tax=Xylella fastidiosa TaxID=2371 RepID=UPI0012AD1E18|nr:hypothetical protein [Xylella fastidiosa]KAJ4853811.1 hypothetical protein XYFPCFBP8418_006205 [Xylella fastidiosa subsp. multiplex]MBE0267984.1 hypothetical protein [Xylella fastidiosa subsp. multiplex]MBE0274567.1 hypothetical protein [Xylella fastidiosa subsp. multiplex]MBE0276630.1 hypothetical protein [Xylella fastidiosa subsp. multiplex]MBE0281038.1 hypothetical protein [Xylella fastidiosa subsp. multiplex]
MEISAFTMASQVNSACLCRAIPTTTFAHAHPSTPSVAAPGAALPTCSVDDLWAQRC